MSYAVVVEDLSKRYRIGGLQHETMLRDALMRIFMRPLVRKEQETIWALKDISFKIHQGEVLGIIGRNGAGKSTLLKVLSKITHPTSGKMKTFGRIASLLEVGTGFHDELTGRENIYLNGSILGMKRREINARMDQIIEFSGVEKFIDTPIKRYSSGMRLRLGFAVAAHLDAEILLVDEVLAVGDAEFQKKCLNTMSSIQDTGRTVLFVSHNMAAVENLCSRVIWVENGGIKNDGDSGEIIRRYMSAFSSAQQAGYDFTQMENRTGAGGIRFTGMEFLDCNGTPKALIRSGEKMTVRLYYRAEQEVINPHFGLDLLTESGIMIGSINTWSAGFEIPRLPEGRGHMELEVDSLNLLPGRYSVSLWLARVGLYYDRLDYCANLDVEMSDFYGTGRGMDKRYFGYVAFPCRWKHFNGGKPDCLPHDPKCPKPLTQNC